MILWLPLFHADRRLSDGVDRSFLGQRVLSSLVTVRCLQGHSCNLHCRHSLEVLHKSLMLLLPHCLLIFRRFGGVTCGLHRHLMSAEIYSRETLLGLQADWRLQPRTAQLIWTASALTTVYSRQAYTGRLHSKARMGTGPWPIHVFIKAWSSELSLLQHGRLIVEAERILITVH